DGIKDRGQVYRGTYAFDLDPAKVQRQILTLLEAPARFYFKQPFLFFHPHLLVNFKVTFETDEKLEEIYSLSIDLATGEIASNLLQELQGKRFNLHPPKKGLEKKKIPYSEGFNALQNHLKWVLRNRDTQWVESARQRWEQEVKYLESYYQDHQANDGDNLSFYRQVAETYRKFRPVIRIHIINTAILYLPEVIYTLEPREPQLNLPPLRFDPVRRKVGWMQFNQ
ncbi:MAG TPA: YqhG family protein, partial [Bacillota bacterium]|nr:YqhG family protein [Bacillota bacterium]